MRENAWKAFLTGAAGGLVAWWAVDRFYRMGQRSSGYDALGPYCAGALAGVAYGILMVKPKSRTIVRVPLGAAVYLADPEHTAAPPKGGRDVPEKAGNLALRMASKGLKRMVERALLV
jgi:hypothetical protein